MERPAALDPTTITKRIYQICITPGSACHHNAVVGFRTSTGDLKLTRYDTTSIATTGIERPVSNTAGAISSTSPIAMTSLPPPTAMDPAYYVVSAFQDGGGDLMLIVWSTLTLARLGDNVLSGFPGAAISEVAVTQVSFDTGDPDSFDRVVTAVRTAEGSLQLTSWDIVDLPGTSDVEVVELDTIAFGNASQIDIDSIGSTIDQSVVVAFRNNSGNLQLKTLAIDAAGDFTELDDYTSGPAGRVKIREWGDGAVTAIRDEDDDLLVTRWDIDGAGNISW
ncbi:hypothetical protein [Nannocystis punicea]|uniref:Lamin Tail Domain n=1 Tax=Nannocystis punicea TaxID=2995304 RepID=A0ABY7H9T3_9BACT|nr:hypothetical protein [Nannocystis poenicansa]WAS96029.1 hypothetical protein O0S08_07680 [Nannocystis poenicansa]